MFKYSILNRPCFAPVKRLAGKIVVEMIYSVCYSHLNPCVWPRSEDIRYEYQCLVDLGLGFTTMQYNVFNGNGNDMSVCTRKSKLVRHNDMILCH